MGHLLIWHGTQSTNRMRKFEFQNTSLLLDTFQLGTAPTEPRPPMESTQVWIWKFQTYQRIQDNRKTNILIIWFHLENKKQNKRKNLKKENPPISLGHPQEKENQTMKTNLTAQDDQSNKWKKNEQQNEETNRGGIKLEIKPNVKTTNNRKTNQQHV